MEAPSPGFERLFESLKEVYGSERTAWIISELRGLLPRLSDQNRRQAGVSGKITQRDIALICYANSVASADRNSPSLRALTDLLEGLALAQYCPIVHILPFYPWDTDRGFSVKDFYSVQEDYGSWDDIGALTQRVKLMFDFVANHASIDNPLIQASLVAKHLNHGDARFSKYKDYVDFAISYSDDDMPAQGDLAKLSRPRACPVLTSYVVIESKNRELRAALGTAQSVELADSERVIGRGRTWTTFSRPTDDKGREATKQVDLNFANPKVFVEAAKILNFYAEKGAGLIRLDAIGYLWKRLGSSSIHEPEAHALVSAMAEVLALAYPQVITVSEVNEPQDRSFTYLGSSERPEADLVYQFSHFPLAIHAIHTGNAEFYQSWLASMNEVGGRQFVTVLGSHDGMGLKPVRGILPDGELEKLSTLLVEQCGCKPNYAVLPGGSKIIYEICATPWNLVNTSNSRLDFETQLARYSVVLILGLSVRGLPAIYFNGIFGAENYAPSGGLDENRTVNRETFDVEELRSRLQRDDSREHIILNTVLRMIGIRQSQQAFDPGNRPLQPMRRDNPAVVSALIPGKGTEDSIYLLANLSEKSHRAVAEIPDSAQDSPLIDLIGGKQLAAISKNKIEILLGPYQAVWLQQG